MTALSVPMSGLDVGAQIPAAGGRPKRKATLIGSLSIFFWATWPTLAIFAAPSPTFQTLALGQAVGFLLLAGVRLLRGQSLAAMLPRSWTMLFFGIVGVLGTNAFVLLAITRIPVAQASLINYTWPMMALLMSGFLGLQTLHLKHYGAILLGFLGVLFVINPFDGLTFDLLGIALALMAGFSYATYTIYRQFDRTTPSDAVGIYNLIAAIFCGAIHLLFETTHAPGGVQLLAIIALGIVPMGLGYALWDYGVARGDARLLSILAYGTPLLATLFLVMLGFAAWSAPLLVGAALIITGAALGTWRN